METCNCGLHLVCRCVMFHFVQSLSDRSLPGRWVDQTSNRNLLLIQSLRSPTFGVPQCLGFLTLSLTKVSVLLGVSHWSHLVVTNIGWTIKLAVPCNAHVCYTQGHKSHFWQNQGSTQLVVASLCSKSTNNWVSWKPKDLWFYLLNAGKFIFQIFNEDCRCTSCRSAVIVLVETKVLMVLPLHLGRFIL